MATIIEKQMDLFDSPANCYLAHCISSDFALGAGIAKEFRNRGVAKTLNTRYPNEHWVNTGHCLPTEIPGFKGAFNLVTKQFYYNKPTYLSLTQALDALKTELYESDLLNEDLVLAMPRIGCGLDRLSWPEVKRIIDQTFEDYDFKILICYL